MTNVKIKLMFFVLNALLTADIVDARPYNHTSHNNTFSDIVLDFSRNSTDDDFHLPVDTNSDTLRVATDDQTVEQTNKNSKTEMEAIVNAEHDRDVLILTKNNLKGQSKVLEIPSDDALALEKQLNTSSPLLEEIIDSEMGREETLTDIKQFRPDIEFAEDLPRFEFLISGKINETNGNGSVTKDGLSGNDLNKERNSSDPMRKSEYVELVALGKTPRLAENKSANYLANITGHEVEDEMEPDTILSVFSGFTDVQTLFLACFATLLPLLGVLFATLWIRCMVRRWCPGCCRKAAESSDSESSDHKQDSSHQIKTPNASTGTGGETLDDSEPAANGSIITMTLKNNHLIVETEERNDITKNGRETKMKYSPDNDGIFVVEVQQSAPYRPSLKSLPNSNSSTHDPQISTNQALIHRVPDELETGVTTFTELEERSGSDKAKGLALSNTGLSISDLSMSSIGSHNASYSYGNQLGYEQGPFGYPVYAGYEVPKEYIGDGIIHDNSREPLLCKTPTDPDKPVVTAAIFKQDSIIGNDVLQGPGYCIEGSSDGPLLSDVQAREVSLQHIHDQMEKKLENGIASPCEVKPETPKKHMPLCRADSLPNRILEDKAPEPIIDKNAAMNTIDDADEDEPPSKEMLKGKRASLPMIRTEMYESVKDAILPPTSPKFETLPIVESFFDLPPPMITITEELEPNARPDEDGS